MSAEAFVQAPILSSIGKYCEDIVRTQEDSAEWDKAGHSRATCHLCDIAESDRHRCRIARIRDGFMKSEGNQRTWHNMPRRPERRACRRHKTEEPHRCIFTSEVPDGKRAVVHKAPDRRFQEQSSNAGLESLINCVPLSLVVRSLTSAFATSSLHHQMPISAHPSCS